MQLSSDPWSQPIEAPDPVTPRQVRHPEAVPVVPTGIMSIEARVARMEAGFGATPPDAAPRPESARELARRRLRRGVRDVRDVWGMRTDPSYRRMARTFDLPDGSDRIYCYHIRKTAGTSLYLSFMALGGEDPMDVWRRITSTRLQRATSGPYSFASNNRRVLAEGAYFYGRSHRPFARQPLPPRPFTVTILRDPVDRVRSYFDYLAAGDDPGLPGRLEGRERSIARDGFDAFLDRVPTRALLAQLAMFSDRLDVSEAADRIAGCSSVFFTEDYADGLADLGRRLRLPLEVRHARVAGERVSLDDGQRERLRLRLEPEFELLRRLNEGGVARIGSRGPD